MCAAKNKQVDQLIVKRAAASAAYRVASVPAARVGCQASVGPDEARSIFLDEPRVDDHVVFTTLYWASKQSTRPVAERPGWRFDLVVVDEAASDPEDSTLAALSAAIGARKLVLVGDHAQLQPYVSHSLRNRGFGKSFMQRYIERNDGRGGVSHVMLREQHRMPPTLSTLCSTLFYGGRLRDASTLSPRGTAIASPLVVVDVSCRMEFDPLERSFYNGDEADACKVVRDRLLQRFGVGDMCVMTPFRAQTNCLRMRLLGVTQDQLPRDASSPTSGDEPSPGATQSPEEEAIASIETIDKFQGSERRVVILAPTAPNASGGLHRAADPHLVNVAISRAKDALIIVGNVSELAARDGRWRAILAHAQTHGVVRTFSNAADVTDDAVDALLDAVPPGSSAPSSPVPSSSPEAPSLPEAPSSPVPSSSAPEFLSPQGVADFRETEEPGESPAKRLKFDEEPETQDA